MQLILSGFHLIKMIAIVLGAAWGIVPGQLLVGHMGRFNLQKNHQFLIEIFEEIVRLKPDSCLLLVGTGEREGRYEISFLVKG